MDSGDIIQSLETEPHDPDNRLKGWTVYNVDYAIYSRRWIQWPGLLFRAPASFVDYAGVGLAVISLTE